MPVAGQPPLIRRHHRVHRPADRIPPPEQATGPAHGSERLPITVISPARRTGIHHQRAPAVQPGKEIRRVPAYLPSLLCHDSQNGCETIAVTTRSKSSATR